MKLARLFLAVLAIGALGACGNSPTTPEAEPAGASREEAAQCKSWETDPVTGATRCSGYLGSGG
jgi:uncharacterized lipoprotein